MRYSVSPFISKDDEGKPVPLAYHAHSQAILNPSGSQAELGFVTPVDGVGSDVINLSKIPTLKLNSNPDEAKLENLFDESLQSAVFEGDLIKFSFTTIVPRKNEEDQPSLVPLFFRAYLDSFGDKYAASWNSFKYIGRAEDFYSYEGFSRSIDISFKIAANGEGELDRLIEKLNLLAGSTAPTYTDGSYMRGNFTSVTVGNYLQNQTGVINSVDLSWNTDYQWDIDRELPMILDVSVSFTPIHSFAPQYGSGFINKTNTLYTGTSNTQENE